MEPPIIKVNCFFLTTTQYFSSVSQRGLNVLRRCDICRRHTFEGDDFAGGVHDGAVGRDRPPDGIGGVGHVHDHHLVLLTHLLADADELIRLHCQIAEANVGWVYTQVLQLKTFEENINI